MLFVAVGRLLMLILILAAVLHKVLCVCHYRDIAQDNNNQKTWHFKYLM